MSRPLSFGSIKVKPPLAAAGLRIGVMGGSFNPPHAGHVLVARTALRRLGLDQFWWVVTPGNPLKSGNGLPPVEARIAACRALARDSRMRFTAFERELGTSFTAATLAFLTRRFPDVRFVWVMGADNLASFHRWGQWREIARTMPIAVVDRPGWRLQAMASPAAHRLARSFVPEARARDLLNQQPPAWTFLSGPLSPLSSTALRTAAMPGASGTLRPAGRKA